MREVAGSAAAILTQPHSQALFLTTKGKGLGARLVSANIAIFMCQKKVLV